MFSIEVHHEFQKGSKTSNEMSENLTRGCRTCGKTCARDPLAEYCSTRCWQASLQAPPDDRPQRGGRTTRTAVYYEERRRSDDVDDENDDDDDVFARYVPETPYTSPAAVPPSHSWVKPEILSAPSDNPGTDEKDPFYEAWDAWDGSQTPISGKGTSSPAPLVGDDVDDVASTASTTDSIGSGSDQEGVTEPASVPSTITQEMASALQAKGYSQPAICKMTPGQAHRIISSSPGSKAISGDLKL